MSTSTKRWVLLATILLASLTAACGGGRTPVGPPIPTGNFSNANLKGQYAFLMSGTETLLWFWVAQAQLFHASRSFTADGSGHITGWS